MKHQFTVHEELKTETHFDNIDEAVTLMTKISNSGGRSYMTRFKRDMVDASGLSSNSSGEKYYNRNNGKLREGALNGRH